MNLAGNMNVCPGTSCRKHTEKYQRIISYIFNSSKKLGFPTFVDEPRENKLLIFVYEVKGLLNIFIK